jgi:hypothetical protein
VCACICVRVSVCVCLCVFEGSKWACSALLLCVERVGDERWGGGNAATGKWQVALGDYTLVAPTSNMQSQQLQHLIVCRVWTRPYLYRVVQANYAGTRALTLNLKQVSVFVLAWQLPRNQYDLCFREHKFERLHYIVDTLDVHLF